MALNVGELYASFGIDSKGLDSQISGIEKKCQSIGSSLTKTGAVMSAAVTAPVLAMGKSIYKAGTEFEAQMSRVTAIRGLDSAIAADVSQIEALTQAALEMGSTTSFTASEAGEALEYMAMAGWDTESMLAGLKPVMDLAAASGEDLGSTSDIVTDAMTAFGYTLANAGGDTEEFNRQITHFSDVLAATATNANTNVGMMGESFKYIAPLAGSLGYSVDDMAIALGLMANNGIKGSQAGTSLRNVLQNMINPTDAQAIAMEKLGLSLTDSNGKVKDFSTLMDDMRKTAKESGVDMHALQKEVEKLDEQLANGTITEDQYNQQVQKLADGSEDFLQNISILAGTRGLSAMLAIMNASDQDFDSLTESILHCDGATAKMAKTMLDNTKGKVTLFQSALEGLEITLWTHIAPAFDAVVEKATEWVEAFRKASPETQRAVLKLAGLAAAAGPAMLFVGGLVTAVGKLAPALALLTSPVGIVAGGLGLMAIAAVDADNEIGTALESMATNGAAKLSSFNTTITETFDGISRRLPELTTSLSNTFETILPAVIETATTAIVGMMNTIAENSDSILGVGLSIITGIVDGLVVGLPRIIAVGLQLVAKLTQSIIKGIPMLALSVLRIGEAIVNGLANTDWSQIGTTVINAIGETLNTITSTEFVGQLKTVAENIITGLGRAIGASFSAGAEIIRGIATALSAGLSNGNISGMLGNLASLGAAVITAIGEAIKSAAGGAASLISAVGELISTALSKGANGESLVGDLSSFGSTIINAIVQALGDAADAAGQIVTALSGLLSDINWSDVGADLGSLAVNLVDSLVSAISGEGMNFDAVIYAVANGLSAAAISLQDAFNGFADTVIDYLLQPATWSKLGDGLLAVMRAVVGGLLTGGLNILDSQTHGAISKLLGQDIESAVRDGLAIGVAGDQNLEINPTLDIVFDDLGGVNVMQTLLQAGLHEKLQSAVQYLVDNTKLTEGQGALLTEYINTDFQLNWEENAAELNEKYADILQYIFPEKSLIDEPLEIEVPTTANPEVESVNEAGLDFSDLIQQEYGDAGIDIQMPVSAETEVTSVETGSGTDIQDSMQEAVNASLSAVTLTADVSVSTSVTVNVSDSNADTIGTQLGEGLGQGVASGIASQNSAVVSAAGSLLNSAGSALRSSSVAENAGMMFGAGFARGISSQISAVRQAAQALANAANVTLPKAIDAHSPSKIALKYGNFFGEGFAFGIGEKIKLVKRETSAMAKTAINALSMNPARGLFGMSEQQDAIARRNSVDYNRLAAALAAMPSPVLQLDGKTVAEVNANNTANAQNARTKTIAMRYGSM